MAKELYKYEGSLITVNPYFIYEVDLCRISKNRFNIIKSRLYKSTKFLKVKDIEVLRWYNSFTVERWITLLAAPMSFIEENDIPLYIKPIKKRKKNERKKN